MHKKIVLVDMDGVLADVYQQFITWHKRETGEELNSNSMNGILEEEAFPLFKKHVNQEVFFRTTPPIEGSIEGLEYLNSKYEVIIVSSATEFPNSLKEKYEWLKQHYPFISWKQMIFCGNKQYITGDIMIDDHVKNLNTFRGIKILFSQPHNANIEDKNLTRVFSWFDIKKIL